MSERRTVVGKIRLLAAEVKRKFPVELWLLNEKVNENGVFVISVIHGKILFV